MPVNIERLQADPEFQRLSPQEQAQLLQAVSGQSPATPPQPSQNAPQGTPAPGGVNLDTLKADPAFQAMSAQEQAQLLQQVQPQAPSPSPAPGALLPVPPADQPLEEGFTKPSTMIPLLTGVGIPGRVAAAPALRGATQLVENLGIGPAYGKLARPVIEGLSQTLGYGTGRTIETGKLPSPGELATEFAVTAGMGRVFEDIGAVAGDVLMRSKGGQAIMTANKTTREAHAKWQADVQAAEEAALSKQKELYDEALIKAKFSQRDYAIKRRERAEKIAASQQEYDTALRTERESLYDARQREIAEQQSGYQTKKLAQEQGITQKQQAYEGAITRQGEVLEQARQIPGRYTPETPSWVLYDKYGDAAKDTVMDLTPANAALAELRAQRGILPDGTMRPFPKAVEDIAANLENATGPVPFETIRQQIRTLGPLTRHADGNIRGPAKQVMGVLADVLDTAPGANDLLKQANATFRREMAVKDMDEWLKTGHGVVSRDRWNREKIDVSKLYTKIDTTLGNDAMFRGSFTPDEVASWRADFDAFKGTRNMPGEPPRVPMPVPVPQPEYLPGSAPNVPGRLMHPPEEPAPVAIPGPVHVAQTPLPIREGDTGTWPILVTPEAPAPVTKYEALGPRPSGAGVGPAYLAQLVGIPPSAVRAVQTVLPGTDQARWLFAHGLMDARRRQMMQAAISGEGILNPQFYSVMLASLSPAERKAFTRETGGTEAAQSESARAPGGAARQTD